LRVRFAIAGLVLGGTWIWRTHAPLWERLLRLVLVMLVIVPAVSWVLRRRHGGVSSPHRRVWRWYWVGAKLGLILLGSLAQLGLEATMSRTAASEIVGAALAIAVAFGGPPLTVWAAKRRAASRSGELLLGR
jgi:cytochrome bd-type quinol oxidase subunit 2